MKLIKHFNGNEVAAVAAGKHVVAGHLLYSYSTGVEPTEIFYQRILLGQGIWHRAVSVVYELPGGTTVIPESDFRFYDGTQTEPSEWFPTDDPHTGFVMLDVKLPEGLAGDGTTIAFGETEIFPDFDEDGNQIDEDGNIVVPFANLLTGTPLDEDAFFYTANPARVIWGRCLKYGKLGIDRCNYEKFVAYRDYCASLESVDYRTIPNLDGFGLTASYYNGTAFDTFVKSRVDRSVYFALSAGKPSEGLTADNFSARWEGFIKPKFSESYTFTVAHTHGAKLVVGGVTLIDQMGASGTHTATFAGVANTFYPIVVEWTHTTGDAEIQLKWNSANTPLQIIKPENLYPKVESRPRYELHDAYSSPTSLDAMIDAGLLHTNSIRQEADGKIEFSCVEQLTPVFHFDGRVVGVDEIILDGTFEAGSRLDVRENQQNVFEADARDLDTEYLQRPENPVRLILDDLVAIAGKQLKGSGVPLPNMTRWQQFKVLTRLSNLAVVNDLKGATDATDRAFKVIAGDLVTMTHESGDYDEKVFQIISTRDYSPDKRADERHFEFQET